ncbi:MAG: peptide-methionine (R)-S-oxide reductase MsrB [Oligoflexales bacterium]
MKFKHHFSALSLGFGIFLCSIACQTSTQNHPPGSRKSDPGLKKLSKIQYQVTQKGATEKAFNNPFWNHYQPGIYVDIVSGDALFSSQDKFDSKSGFPSFKAPISDDVISLIDQPYMLVMSRVELRAKKSNSHLGHLFMDGPGKDKKHYCVNSASLKFIPLKDLESMGYGKYKNLFSNESKIKQ